MPNPRRIFAGEAGFDSTLLISALKIGRCPIALSPCSASAAAASLPFSLLRSRPRRSSSSSSTGLGFSALESFFATDLDTTEATRFDSVFLAGEAAFKALFERDFLAWLRVLAGDFEDGGFAGVSFFVCLVGEAFAVDVFETKALATEGFAVWVLATEGLCAVLVGDGVAFLTVFELTDFLFGEGLLTLALGLTGLGDRAWLFLGEDLRGEVSFFPTALLPGVLFFAER